MAKQPSKKIKATELASLVLSGMDDAQLMARYNISAKKLNSIFNKLIEAGFLEPPDLVGHNWTPPSDLTNGDGATHAISYNPEETDTIEKTLKEKEQTETILESVFQKMLEEGIVDGRKVADLKKSTKRKRNEQGETVILSADTTSQDKPSQMESSDVPTEELLDTSFGEDSQGANKDFLATADIANLVKGGSGDPAEELKDQNEESPDEPYEPTIELARRAKEDDPTADEFLTTSELENIVTAPWNSKAEPKAEDEKKARDRKKPAPSDNRGMEEEENGHVSTMHLKKRGEKEKNRAKPTEEPKIPENDKPAKKYADKKKKSRPAKQTKKKPAAANGAKAKSRFTLPEIGQSGKTGIAVGVGVAVILALVGLAYQLGLLSPSMDMISSVYNSILGPPTKSIGNGKVAVKTQQGTKGQDTSKEGKKPVKRSPPKNRTTALLGAVKKGDAAAVKQALSKGANPNARNKAGLTPLMIAADNNYPAIVSDLLANKADPNLLSPKGENPLMMASEQGFNEVVQSLLKKGAITDLRRKDGATAMDLAAIKGHTDVVNSLIKADANINARYAGKTPLMLAIENGHEQTANLLIEKGAFVNAIENQGASALFRASSKGMDGIVSKLCSFCAKVDQPNESGATPLMAAAGSGNLQSVKILLDNGADLKATDKQGDAPLFYAIKAPDKETIELLLEKGAAIDTKNADGLTPLMVAAENGSTEAVKVLIEKGADPGILKEDSDLTALNLAMEKGHAEVINLLLAAGSGEGAQQADLTGYLISALVSGENEVVKTLLQKGVDVNKAPETEQFKGKSPILIAAELNKPEILALLIEHGANIEQKGPDGKTPLMTAFEKGNREAIKVLAEKGANVNAKGQFENTPLIIATQKKDQEMVEFLLENRADPNSEGAFFKTALDFAVKNGDLEIAETLLAKGANINRRARSDGKTPLMMAAESGNKEMVELLLKHNADITIQDNIGYTANKYALMNGHMEVLKLLSPGNNPPVETHSTPQPSASVPEPESETVAPDQQ